MTEIILGYIYILTSSCYGKKIKIGSTRDISRRKWDYFTYIPKTVKYYNYFEILDYGDFSKCINPIISMEKTLYKNNWFQKRRYLKNKEFFSIRETNLIEYSNNVKYILDNYGVKFRMIKEDIFLTRPKRENNSELENCRRNWKNIEYKQDVSINANPLDKIVLRNYQEECINLMKENNIGKFILPTGTGKTVIFLRYLSFSKKSLILVPFIELINQVVEKSKYFNFGIIMSFCNGRNRIINRKNKGDNILYISTYQSSDKEKYEFLKEKFDCIIFDECHYTVVNEKNDNSTFQYMISNGKSNQKFFFTATEKNIRVKNNEKTEEIFSMDNEKIYGPILYQLFLDTAIQNKILTDYNINFWLCKNKLKCLGNIIENKIGKRILIFCSRLSIVEIIKVYIKENYKEIYVDIIDGNTKNFQRSEVLKKFREFNGISILVLCKMLSVGFDEPMVDIIIHYNRCNSSIDFMQKNGRSLRLFPEKNKSNIIILTNIEDNDQDIKYYKTLLNTVFAYDRRIIQKMKNLKENKERGIYSSIDIKYDETDNVVYNIYDRYMNYLSSHLDYNGCDVIERVKIVVKYYNDTGVWPWHTMSEILGEFPSTLKKNFVNKIRDKKVPISYKDYTKEIINIFSEKGLWDKLMIKKEDPIELTKLIVNFYKQNNRYPRSKDNFLASFPETLKKKFINKIRKHEEPVKYKDIKDEIISIFQDTQIWEILIKKKNDPIEQVKLLIKYCNEKGIPKCSETFSKKYDKLNEFYKKFKEGFINPMIDGKKPIFLNPCKKEIMKILNDAKLWDKLAIKKQVILNISILEKVDLYIAFYIEYKREPRDKEKYEEKYKNLGSFPNSFKYDFIHKIIKKEEITKYAPNKDKIVEKLKTAGIWNKLMQKKIQNRKPKNA